MDLEELTTEVRLTRLSQELMAKDITEIKSVLNDPDSGLVGRVKVIEARKWQFTSIWTIIAGIIAGLIALARGH